MSDLRLTAFLGTADIWIHVVHTSSVIIAKCVESQWVMLIHTWYIIHVVMFIHMIYIKLCMFLKKKVFPPNILAATSKTKSCTSCVSSESNQNPFTLGHVYWRPCFTRISDLYVLVKIQHIWMFFISLIASSAKCQAFCSGINGLKAFLTHWGWVVYICISKKNHHWFR